MAEIHHDGAVTIQAMETRVDELHGVQFIAIIGGEFVGCAHVSDTNAPALWLGNLFVDGRFRGRGVGAKLVNAVFRWGAERGKEAVSLSVANENTGAQRLYRRLGFIPAINYADTKQMAYTHALR